MGRWNRRYLNLPSQKYRNYDYEDPPSSSSGTCDDPSSSSGDKNNRVPSWEIDYCKSARVPWNKVLASKKYIYCYPSVLNWDASACKEALENAKQRYWAMINGFPFDTPLPNPDMYIDEIDWNANMDPELMEDLDRQLFNPDERSSVERLETINEEDNDKNQPTMGNPWKRNIVQGNESSKDTEQGWGKWGDSVNLKNENPWERDIVQGPENAKDAGWGKWGNSVSMKNENPWKQSCNRPLDSWKDNAWKSGNESWGWDQTVRQEGWGQREVNYGGWNERNDSGEKLRNFESYGYSWETQNYAGSKGRDWTENGNQTPDSSNWDSSHFKRSGTSFRGGCRKRENSVQYTSKYKNSRYQGYK